MFYKVVYFVKFSGVSFKRGDCDQGICPYCQKHCRRHLRRHIKAVHLKMKPFKCEHCDSTFSQKGNLSKHVKRMHVAQQPREADPQTMSKEDVAKYYWSIWHWHGLLFSLCYVPDLNLKVSCLLNPKISEVFARLSLMRSSGIGML